MSVATGGAEGNWNSEFPSFSADGRYVIFSSGASNLVAGDALWLDVFVRDLWTASTERVSVNSSGVPGDDDSGGPGLGLSADGRFAAFGSIATNLVPGDTNGMVDIFVHDRQTGATERVSVDSAGGQANADSGYASISADGRYVVFFSHATNLVAGDTNGKDDVFVHDRQTGTTERVSVSSTGVQGDRDAANGPPQISADGRFAAFVSGATNLVPGDTNNESDVFVHDLQSGATERVSVSSTGVQADHFCVGVSISGDGRFVAFASQATNLDPVWDGAYRVHVYVRDRLHGTTERVSVDSTGALGAAPSDLPSISADGRYVAFESDAFNLVPSDTNNKKDIFVHDRQTGENLLVSVDSARAQGNGNSTYPAISADGRFVAFDSVATNLVPGDTNGHTDVFLRDQDADGFRSLCDPGLAGVVACPCSNPPVSQGRGCDNSSGTGGALLADLGVAYLSMDSLVFRTGGEKPTALSIVVQGTASLGAGAVFGQGVRCVAGTLTRLYTKTASAGAITAPDFAAGDPTVSARSASLGDAIQPGQSRWYFVYYRDPIVLGGCPAGSTFNATQTGEVGWLP